MISFEDLTSQLVGDDVLKQLGKSVGAKPTKVQKATMLSIPTLMEALNRNTNNKQGAKALAKALDQHDNEDVDDVGSFLKNVDTEDGQKILSHIFGEKSDQVQKGIAKQSGVSKGKIGNLLIMLAPLLIAYLGRKKKEDNLDASGVSNETSLLSGLFGGGGGGLFGGGGGGLLGGLLGGGNSGSGNSGGGLLDMASSFLGSGENNNSSSGGGLLSGLANFFK